MEYIPTVLICIGLVALFAFLIYSLVRDKKKGKGCCGSCANCNLCDKTEKENK